MGRARRLVVQVGRRGLRTLAEDAIKNDFMKGLVELVTNADDSYCNIEKSGRTSARRIEISLVRRPRMDRSILKVKDLAEGLDAVKMEECIATYGEETSTSAGRGVFGMGLKDTINAFGDGNILSIKDGRLYRCVLKDYNDLKITGPRTLSKRDQRILGIPANGTLVEIKITNPRIRIPIFDTLKRDIQTHVCLRRILTDPNRVVVLSDKDGNEHFLKYEMPEHDVLLTKEFSVPGYETSKARLTVRKAKCVEPLTQSGSCRTGGILIISRRAVHEATLFGFDDNPYADHLFGELECDDIYELQRNGEMVVTRTRDGLEQTHPFAKGLWKLVAKEIEVVVKKIKEEAEKSQREIENEETKKRFREAVKSLNQIAIKHLGDIGGEGTGGGRGVPPPPMHIPLDGFEFIPDDYRILIGSSEALKLRIAPDSHVKISDLIQFSSESRGIRLVTTNACVPEPNKEGLCTLQVIVEGVQPGAETFITATCNNKSAAAYIEVVSELKTRERQKQGGLFKDIKYGEKMDTHRRVWYMRSTGMIHVNTGAPSISLYFGREGEGQNDPQNRVLVAELVTEVATLEIGNEAKRTKKYSLPPGVDEFTYFHQFVNVIKDECAETIHKVLVDRKYRRR